MDTHGWNMGHAQAKATSIKNGQLNIASDVTGNIVTKSNYVDLEGNSNYSVEATLTLIGEDKTTGTNTSGKEVTSTLAGIAGRTQELTWKSGYDLLVYKYSEQKYLLVVNASRIDIDYNWINENIKKWIELVNDNNHKELMIDTAEKTYSENYLKMLNDELEREENNMFFICPEGHYRLVFDDASDCEFMCPECGEELEFQENEQIISQIKEDIKMVESNFNSFTSKNKE